MSSFRDQLGEDWLRYQHHLDEAQPSTVTTAVVNGNPPTQPLPNGLNTTTSPSTSLQSMEVPEVLPPPLLSSEPRLETSIDADFETESTLQWHGTLEESTVDDPMESQEVEGSPEPSPGSQKSVNRERADTKEEEEEEDLGGRVLDR